MKKAYATWRWCRATSAGASAGGIVDALRKGATADRFTRGFLPGSTGHSKDTGFFFMTLGVPKLQLAGGYEQYRAARRHMLETYAFAMLQKHPELQRVVGIATEPPGQGEGFGSSEDLIMAPQPEWTPKLLENWEEQKRFFNIFDPDNYVQYAIHDNEFPEGPRRPAGPDPVRLTRAQRRAKAAKDRRQQRKRSKLRW